MSEAIVRVEGLVKRYDGKAALAGLDLTVRRGEIVALLGPNGAGKTTTVEIVEGYRAPDDGTVRVFGLDPRRHGQRIKPRLGLMLQDAELYGQIRVLEALTLFAAFYPLPLEPHALLAQVGLEGLGTRRYRSLSGGERQRLQLGLALVGRPELAILDEPTASMDVAARQATWTLLRELRERGASILLTTHLLDEAEALADRIAILDRGRLVAIGSARQIGAEAGGASGRRTVRVELEEPLDRSAETRLSALPGVDEFRVVQPGIYWLATVVPAHVLVEVATLLRDIRREPLAITVGGSSLEEAFLRLTGADRRSADPDLRES